MRDHQQLMLSHPYLPPSTSHLPYNRVMQCQIKSKYRGVWQASTLSLDSDSMALILTRDGTSKCLPLPSITRCELVKEQLLVVAGERQYQIRGGRPQQVVEAFKLWAFFRDYKEVPEQKMQKPKTIDYVKAAAVRAQRERQEREREGQQQQQQKQQEGGREEAPIAVVQYEDYYKRGDWLLDESEGGLLFINEEKKSLQPKIIKFVISKFLSTGSFMGISFPVFAMKPETMLETYCRCFSLAPRLLSGVKNPLERMKAFNAVIITASLRFIDIDKSFNPAIGETFHATVDGRPFAAEQVSHHPPISAFLIDGEDFKLYGSLEVQASMGFNSARGRFYGDIVVEYADGGRLVGRLPCGILQGYLFGRYVFYPDGACFIFDPLNQLFCSYRVTEQDVMEGYIGKLNRRAWSDLLPLLTSSPSGSQREQKYSQFQHVGEEQCEKVYVRVRNKWTQSIHYDEQLYIHFEDNNQRPPKLTPSTSSCKLPSDSRHRKDIQLRAEGRMEESQEAKEAIEQEERRLRKLRQAQREQ